jgi:LuxR family transcriptional regulator, maltose regulon positive regulatory protein
MRGRVSPAMNRTSPLLETKLYVPASRRGDVPRPRLGERLDRGAATKLTLVSAPAGFGKTTLLAAWLPDWVADAPDAPAGPRSVAWLSLDQGDNHPATFWTSLVAALRTAVPGVGAGALSLLQSPRPPPIETVLAPLLNELGAVRDELVLVLDDYHVIVDRDVRDGMAFLIDHLPPRVHLVIASRADPVLPLARLRARGELVELRAADLRFTTEEAAAFLNGAMGLALTLGEVATLEGRAEGWIAALQLAALSMRGRDDAAGFIDRFGGDDRHVVDYLVGEVLQRQPARVRSFLLATAVLERLSGPLCDAVTGQDGGRAMLEALERENLFVVPLDDRRRWYRYHHLFADVLRAHLVDERPGDVAALHRRASDWYEQNGERPEAIRHALAGGDFERAAGLVELAARATLRGSRSARLLEWLRALPDDAVRPRPVLSVYYAFALFGSGELDAAAARLRDAERWLDAGAGADASAGAGAGALAAGEPAGRAPAGMVVAEAEELRSVPGIIALAWAFYAQVRGDTATTRDEARRALALMPESDHVWRGGAAVLLALTHWAGGDLAEAQHVHDGAVASLERSGDISLAISACYDGADLRKARGRLSEAERTYQRALRLAHEHGDPVILGVADLHLGLSDVYRERDDLNAARGHLRRAEELGSLAALPQTASRECVARARLRQVEGDPEGALDLLDRAERLYVRGPVPEVRPIAALRVRVWVTQGRLAEALDWTRAQGLSAGDDVSYPREYAHITLARALIAQRDGDAPGLLGRLLVEADAHGRTGSAIEILVLQALAHRAQGQIASGLGSLGRALALAEPEGYVRTFVDEGEPMRDLLRHAVAAGLSGAYAARLLSALGEPAHSGSLQQAAASFGLVEPLTAREVEIMRLVAVGMRNQEIADQLVISLPTVKRHIANSYGKLGAGHRTEAVARANELGLLERPARR